MSLLALDPGALFLAGVAVGACAAVLMMMGSR